MSLGFIPNLKKSDLKPAQQFTFIGMEFLTQQNIVRVPPDCIKSLLQTIRQFLTQTQVLQICLLSVWRPLFLPLDHQVPITSMIRFHLKWWMDTNRFVQGMFIHPPDPNASLFMDASQSQTDETILSWLLEGRPIPAPYSRNNGHLFCTEESHTIHTPLLYYNIH